MRSIGASWRFGGPVVDLPCRLAGVSVNRGFSDNPEKVSRLAVAAIRGMQSVGVAAATKHFPGYDPYEFRDNHYSATQISLSLEEWEKTQHILEQLAKSDSEESRKKEKQLRQKWEDINGVIKCKLGVTLS